MRPATAKPGTSWKENEEQAVLENRLPVIFLGILCATFIVVLDQAMVSTALPTIVEHLGGANNYSWLGSAYLLGSSALVPLYGKWSDMLGRKSVIYIPFYLSRSVVAIVLFVFLNLNPHQSRPFRGRLAELDFVDLTFIALGMVPLIIGFDFWRATYALCYVMLCYVMLLTFLEHQFATGSDVKAIVLVVIGCVTLIAGGISEIFVTQRSQIMPSRSFKTRTTRIILVMSFSHGIVYFGAIFRSTTKYWVLTDLPAQNLANISPQNAPVRIGYAIASILSGIVVLHTGSYQPTFWVAWTSMAPGWGFMTTLNTQPSVARQASIPLLAALGDGCLLQVPVIAMQASMPLKDMVTGSSAVEFLRSLGGAIGVFSWRGHHFECKEIMNTFPRTISQIWVMFAALSGFGLVLALFMHGYSLKRKVVHGGDGAEKVAEALVLEDYVKAYSTSGSMATLEKENRYVWIPLEASP
ncbi:MFS general substrate transporter [Rhizopogon salebrosus TDB-379]|nr:MFS general substrate transporter [Rhizopogon salebrosus TDB-379]